MASLGITAYAMANGLGRDAETVLEGLYAGKRGVVDAPDWMGVPTKVGMVPGELAPLPARLATYDTRQARLLTLVLEPLMGVVESACARYGPQRVAILLGTSTAGVADTETAFAEYVRHGSLPATFDFRRQHAFEAIVAVTRELTGVRGPGYVVSTACSSSGRVFASARRLLRAGVVDAAIVGGVDSLCALTVRGFRALDVTSETPCRPFGRDRGGINIGEGGALFVLEREGGPFGVLGVGESSDAHHMTAPHPEGRGAKEAMLGAMRQGGIACELPRRMDGHVNAHGTGTRQNDAVEMAAVRAVVADTPVVATKGATGHLLGAAGATELAFALAALERDELPPSVGADPVDEGAQSVVTARRRGAGSMALSNSFAFGGANVSVLVGRAH